MWKHISARLDPRLAVVSIFSASLFLSLLCSLSVQEAFGDAAVAASARNIEPLEVGQDAPRFVVRGVDGELFEAAREIVQQNSR